jgi:hypothetical protein
LLGVLGAHQRERHGLEHRALADTVFPQEDLPAAGTELELEAVDRPEVLDLDSCDLQRPA